MIEASAISAAFTSLKTIKDMAEAMITLRDAQTMQPKFLELNAKIAEAQEAIFSVNNERAALIERIHDFEKEIADIKAWDAEKSRYELKKISEYTAIFAYSLKQEEQTTEPAHHICANCYEHRQKSILQFEKRYPGACDVFVCHSCGSELYAIGFRMPEHSKVKARSR